MDNAINENVLADAFIPFGQIVDVTLPKADVPSQSDPHRGFGYVEFELAMDAIEAIDNMDQSELYGRVIKVAPAKPQKNIIGSLGSKTAVWEQEGYLAKHAVRDDEKLSMQHEPISVDGGAPDVEDLDIAGPKEA